MLLMVKGSSKSKAKDHLKKLNLNGERSVMWATFPKKNFLTKIKKRLLAILLLALSFLTFIYLLES